MRVPLGRTSGELSLENIQTQIDQIATVVNGNVELGLTQDEKDLSSTILPSQVIGIRHQGTAGNVAGVWATLNCTAAGHQTEQVFHHLHRNEPNYTSPVAAEPDCRFIHVGTNHDGQIGAATNPHIRAYVTYAGGLHTANTIFLEVFITTLGTPAPTINATFPVYLTLFLFKAIRSE